MAEIQAHYRETMLGSILRQWETAETMKALPESWLLPQAISAALYNHNSVRGFDANDGA